MEIFETMIVWCEIIARSLTHADVLSSIFMDTLDSDEFLMIFIDPYSFLSISLEYGLIWEITVRILFIVFGAHFS